MVFCLDCYHFGQWGQVGFFVQIKQTLFSFRKDYLPKVGFKEIASNTGKNGVYISSPNSKARDRFQEFLVT